MDEMKTAEIWSITRTGQGNVVFLRPLSMEIVVPIYIGQLEAQSILLGLGDQTLPRPLSHDLFLSLLPYTGLDLARVEIRDFQGDTFFASLIITGREFSGERALVLDARPSDALALAVRRKCPVAVAEKVIRLAGTPADAVMEAALGNAAGGEGRSRQYSFSGPTSGKREALLEELDQAVAAEEYERAAELRDLLTGIDGERRQEP
jgi:bifunctional DNase/RNase